MEERHMKINSKEYVFEYVNKRKEELQKKGGIYFRIHDYYEKCV